MNVYAYKVDMHANSPNKEVVYKLVTNLRTWSSALAEASTKRTSNCTLAKSGTITRSLEADIDGGDLLFFRARASTNFRAWPHGVRGCWVGGEDSQSVCSLISAQWRPARKDPIRTAARREGGSWW